MQDIELLGQAAAVVAGSDKRRLPEQLHLAEDLGWIAAAEREDLARAHRLYRAVQATRRLLGGSDLASQGAALILRETGTETLEDLSQGITEAAQKAATVIERVLQSGAG